MNYKIDHFTNKENENNNNFNKKNENGLNKK